MNTKAFALSGAIQTSKELVALYADGSDTLEAQFAKSIWDFLDNHQRVLIREFKLPDPITNEHSD